MSPTKNDDVRRGGTGKHFDGDRQIFPEKERIYAVLMREPGV